MIKFSLNKNIRRNYQPKSLDIGRWLRRSLIHRYKNVYIDFSIVDSVTSKKLNYQYRHKNNPTNIISLEYDSTRDNFAMLMGELILCDEVIVNEAKSQNKSIIDHYAHMIVHGMLHLQGLDHITPEESKHMEMLEIQILSKFDIRDPYIINSNDSDHS
ncbi:MAG: putative rRNA maturation factor [Pseudomonadota bacterium]|nr:putative rRNA maturation factor [Pseudomonadota bacterium]